ncbi:hypothetical protein PFISCL1PPCAC_26962, partial [Pristionchus fissidentatus]
LSQLENLVRDFDRLHVGDKNAKLRKSAARPTFVARIFYDGVRLLKEADALVRIDPCPANKRACLVISSFLSSFFTEFVAKLPIDFIENIEANMADAGVPKHSLEIRTRNLVLPQLIIDREENRKSSRRFLDVQRMAQQKESGVELDIDEEEVKQCQTMTKEEAVLMIQSFERVYQAISRRDYLRHVMQKAMDLRSEKKKMDPLQAVIKIQARTRGYFTRKKVREMREKEHELLGISVKGTLLQTFPVASRLCPRQYSTEKDTSFKHLQSSSTSIQALLNDIKSTYFQIGDDRRSDGPRAAAAAFDEQLENLYADLYLRRVITNPTRILAMDSLISQRASISIGGTQFSFDLRNLMHMFAVIPLQLHTWSSSFARPWILLIGDELSGKSAWVDALSTKTNAVLIRLNKRVLAKNRSLTIGTVLKVFVRRNDHSIVSIDRLESFRAAPDSGNTYRSSILSSLKALSKTSAFVIGMSRIEEITQTVADYFPIKIHMEKLDNISKIGVITHSLHRLGDPNRIPKLPQRLTEMRKATSKYNSGGTVQFVQRKFARIARNYV